MKKLLTAIVASLIPVISFAQNNVQGSLYRVNNMGGPGIKRHYYRIWWLAGKIIMQS
jgi:hypothetical protein